MKHTPGPWIASEWPKPNIDGPTLKIDIQHRSPGKDGGVHATVIALHWTPEADATCRANAALIAAAPDLLAACQSIAKDGADWLSDEAAEMLRAAIAKAQGGAA